MRLSSRVSPNRLASFVALMLSVGTTAGLGSTLAIGYVPAVRAQLGWTQPATVAYLRGQQFDLPAGAFGGRQQALVAFASAVCGPSVRSGPGLSTLADALRHSRTRFVLVTPRNVMSADQDAFVHGLRLAPSEHISLDLAKARVKTIPAVVLVDSTGRVLYSREGLLDEGAVAAVLRAVEAGGR